MIRPVVLLAVIALTVLAGAVYEVEHRVQDLRRQLAVTQKQIVNDRQEIHVLRAEWSYLSQPTRIEAKSKALLDLADIRVDQVMEIEDIPLKQTVLVQPAAGGGLVAQQAVRHGPGWQ